MDSSVLEELRGRVGGAQGAQVGLGCMPTHRAGCDLPAPPSHVTPRTRARVPPPPLPPRSPPSPPGVPPSPPHPPAPHPQFPPPRQVGRAAAPVANPKEATNQRKGSGKAQREATNQREGWRERYGKTQREATNQREGCRERAQGSGRCWGAGEALPGAFGKERGLQEGAAGPGGQLFAWG
eukprot:797679-Prymnesium_polylepis.1